MLLQFFKSMDVGRENGNRGTILVDGKLACFVDDKEHFVDTLTNLNVEQPAKENQFIPNVEAISELLNQNKNFFADYFGLTDNTPSTTSTSNSTDSTSSRKRREAERNPGAEHISTDDKFKLFMSQEYDRLLVLFSLTYSTVHKVNCAQLFYHQVNSERPKSVLMNFYLHQEILTDSSGLAEQT